MDNALSDHLFFRTLHSFSKTKQTPLKPIKQNNRPYEGQYCLKYAKSVKITHIDNVMSQHCHNIKLTILVFISNKKLPALLCLNVKSKIMVEIFVIYVSIYPIINSHVRGPNIFRVKDINTSS